MIFDFPIVLIRILYYNQFYTPYSPLLKKFERGGLNERV